MLKKAIGENTPVAFKLFVAKDLENVSPSYVRFPFSTLYLPQKVTSQIKSVLLKVGLARFI